MWHVHKWKRIAAVYNPPINGKFDRMTPEMFQMIMFGITNVTYQCTKCSEKKVVKYVGKVDGL